MTSEGHIDVLCGNVSKDEQLGRVVFFSDDAVENDWRPSRRTLFFGLQQGFFIHEDW